MTAIPFDSFIRMVAKGARREFERDKEVKPTAIMVNAAGELIIAPMAHIWRDDAATKDVVFAAIRAIAKEKHAVRCAFVSEAWALDSDDVGKDAVRAAFAAGSLADAPGRREVVQINAEDQHEGQRQNSMEIVRPAGRDPYLLALRLHETPIYSEGRGVGLLPATAAEGRA